MYARLLASLFFLLGMLPAVFAQSEFVTPAGDQIIAGSDTDIIIDNPLSDTKVITLTPQEGFTTAHLTIRSKENEITEYYAKKIFYDMGTEIIRLDGDARIKKADDYMYGPVSIHFLPEKNMLEITGTAQDPASFLYTVKDKNNEKWSMEAVKIQFTFKKVDSKRELIRLETVKNTLTRNYPKNAEEAQKLMRKISPPK